MTADQQMRLTALRELLPPIVTDHERGMVQLAAWAAADLVALDAEWSPKSGELELIGVGNERGVVQIEWAKLDDSQQAEAWAAIAALVRRVPAVYHHAISDLKKLRQFGFDVHPATHFDIQDTCLAHAVLHSEEEHTLEYLCTKGGKLPPHKDLAEVDPSVYNATDVVETVFVWRWIVPQFDRDPAARGIYEDLSLAYLKEIQLDAEEFGVAVNRSVPYVLLDKYAEKREQAARMAAAYAGGPGINLGSSKDLKRFLFVLEGLPEQREKSFGGVPGKLTTDKDAIATLRRGLGTEWDADEEPTLEAAWANIEAGGNTVLEARYLYAGAQQALSHYVAPCFEIDTRTGDITGIRDRIYPETRLHVQASGRPSIVGPALQQFKGELLTLICPDEGTCWVGWDWNRIEPRLLYYLANDLPGIRACESGEDIYQPGIRAIFPEIGSPELEEVRRRFGKALILRIHYRGNPKNAGDIPGTRALGLKVSDLVVASERYLAEHPALPEHWKKVDAQIDRSGVVYTWAGRPRRLTNPHPAARYREGSNHLCQGGVADVYLLTALAVKRAAPWSRLVYGAHDAQTHQVPVERREEFRALIEPIVQREFCIAGRSVSFPATFKERLA